MKPAVRLLFGVLVLALLLTATSCVKKPEDKSDDGKAFTFTSKLVAADYMVSYNRTMPNMWELRFENKAVLKVDDMGRQESVWYIDKTYKVEANEYGDIKVTPLE